MSDAIFPELPGLEWKNRKSPEWNTGIQRAASRRELRATFMSAPIYNFSLSYEFLREGVEAEVETLIGFFNARKGRFDSFLFEDPLDHVVSGQLFGAGDGTTTKFQLVRSFGGNTEPVMNLNGTPFIKKAGVSITPASIVNGLVTFSTAPAAGAALTWSGAYYYRCRFAEDTADFENFLYRLWELRQLEFVGCLGNKI